MAHLGGMDDNDSQDQMDRVVAWLDDGRVPVWFGVAVCVCAVLVIVANVARAL